MKRTFITLFRFPTLLILGLMLSLTLQAQPGAWQNTRIDNLISSRSANVPDMPEKYRTLSLDQTAMQDVLWQARRAEEEAGIPVEILIPNPDGGVDVFRMVEEQVFGEEIAARYAETIKAFSGYKVSDPSITVRASLSQIGFYAVVFDPEDIYMVEPIPNIQELYYMSYFHHDHPHSPIACRTKEIVHEYDEESARSVVPTTLRQFRLVYVGTGEYGVQFGVVPPGSGGTPTIANVQASIATSVNIANGVYKRDVGVTFLNNTPNSLIFLNPATDPYDPNNDATMLTINQTQVDNAVGNANYDIGHVVAFGNFGGVAAAAACDDTPAPNNAKAQGYSSSDASLTQLTIDYFCHEAGHQLGANHTYSASMPNCNTGVAGNRYEPGEGTSIMAYSLVCSQQDNIQSGSDPAFSCPSINEIHAFINSNATCHTNPGGTNPEDPTVSCCATLTIPQNTPFVLVGTVTDPTDQATIISNWEQFDSAPEPGTNGPQACTATTGPMFRFIMPSANGNKRVFPSTALMGNNAPTSGTQNGVWEQLPCAPRTMNFRLVGRDNNANFGRTAKCATVVTVNNDAAFAVTAPNGGENLMSNTTVTWSGANAGTCATVDIYLSTNGGTTYGTALATNVANTGSAMVNFPAGMSSTARIIVQCHTTDGGFLSSCTFFDASNANFSYNSMVANCSITNVAPGTAPTCDPANANNATFGVSFNVTTGSGNYNLIDVTNPGTPLGQIVGGMTNGTGLMITGTFTGPTTGQTIMVNVVDATTANCMGSPIAITLPTCPIPSCSISATAIPTNPNCPGASDGSIMVNAMATGCNGTLEYSLNGGSFQSSNNFSGLAAGSYTIVVRCSTMMSCTTTVMTTLLPGVDNTPPMVSCPPDRTLACGATVPSAATTQTQFTAQGGSIVVDCGPVTISHSDNQTGNICSGITLTRTYSITESSTVTCIQTFNIAAPSAPVISCPADQVVTCFEDIVADPANLTVTVSCGVDYKAYVKQPLINGGIPGCHGTVYTYIYKVVDECGNMAECEQQFLIQNDAPTVMVPSGETVDCSSEINVSVNDATVVTDCPNDTYVINILNPPVINGPANCPGTTYTYTYRVKDNCNRIVEVDRVFTIGQTAPPTIVAPDDLTINCLASAPINPDNATVSASCDSGSYSVSVEGPVISGDLDCPGTTYTYNYVVIDACGRTAMDQQVFTVNNEGPVMNCPGDLQITNCDYGGYLDIIYAWIASVKASSACGNSLVVNHDFNPNNLGMCYWNNFNAVNFTATDNCGRTVTCTAQIIIFDNEAPFIYDEAQDEYAVCNENTAYQFQQWLNNNAYAGAVDACSGQNLNWFTIPANPTYDCSENSEVEVTFCVEDQCGNTSCTVATFYTFSHGNNMAGDLENGNDKDRNDLNQSPVNDVQLFQNRPNPFNQETTISFYLPEAQEASLVIYDLNGRVLKVFQGDYSAGYNEVRTSRSELNVVGMLFYELKTANGAVVKKMVIAE